MYRSLQRLALGTITTVLMLTPAALRAQDDYEITNVPPIYEEVNLTDDQREELLFYLNDTKAKIEAVITDEQRQILEDTLAAGDSLEEGVAAMNITPDQEQQLIDILTAHRQEMFGVLDESQQQQLIEVVQERRQQRQNQTP